MTPTTEQIRAALDVAPELSAATVIAIYGAMTGVVPAAKADAPEWMTCETRHPWAVNSLRARAVEMRQSEKRCRGAFRKDYMGEPARYFADALGEAAEVFEARLASIEAALKESVNG